MLTYSDFTNYIRKTHKLEKAISASILKMLNGMVILSIIEKSYFQL